MTDATVAAAAADHDDAFRAVEAAMVEGGRPLTPAPRAVFAGLTLKELLVILAFAVVTLWAAWATRELLALKERRTVSVSLATMVQSFVAAEARRGADRGEAAARTKAYLGAIDAAMRAISSDGTTILVSEAVLGNSVPDVTETVMKAVNARIGLSPAAAAPQPPVTGQILPTTPASASALPADPSLSAVGPKPWATQEQLTADQMAADQMAAPELLQ